MSLTVAQDFPALGGSRRPLLAKLTSDNNGTGENSKATATIQWASACLDNEDLVLKFGAYTLTFLGDSTPDDNAGTAIPTGTTSVATISSYLSKNYILDQFFDITYNSGLSRITLTAKSSGPDYNLSWSGAMLNTRFSIITNLGGLLFVPHPNMQVWADLYVENTYLSNTYTLVAKLSATRNPVNFAYWFDPSAIIDSYLSDYPPILNDIAIRNASDAMLCRYYIKYCEAYGSPISPRTVTKGGTKHALRGRMPHNAVGNPGNTLPYYAVNPSSQMLTERSKTKNVTFEQNEFLYLLSADGTDVDIVLTVYFTDGTTATPTPPAVSSGDGYTVHVIPAGYNQLTIGSVNPAKTVSKYTLYITSGAGLQSGHLYTYNVIPKCPPEMRWFVFRNELGGYDTLPLHGRLLSATEADRSSALAILPANYTALDREHLDFDTRSQDLFEVHTGYHLSKADVEYYARQLLMSENIYLHDAAGFTPVNLLTKDLDYHRDRTGVYGFRVKFRRATRHIDRHTTYQK